MTIPAYTRPDNTSQTGTAYKANLDTAATLAERLGLAFLAQAQTSPNMTVRVLAGALLVDGALTEIAAQNTGTITAPVANPRIDRVVIDAATGAVSVVTGAENASPVAPAIPSGKLPVCRVALATSTAAITPSLLTDERARATGTAALRNVGTGPTDVPTNADISTGSRTITAGEDLADRDLIYLDYANTRGNGADRWYKVDTDATGPVKISARLGIALAAISSGATGLAQTDPGRVSGFTSLTAGGAVWASATAGALTQTAPAVPGTGTQIALRRIGFAASATAIDFDPEDDTLYVARNSALTVGSSITVEHYTDAGGPDRTAEAYLVQTSSSALVSGGAGTAIGNMASSGGLAAAFNGVNDSGGNSATLSSGSGDATIGKDWGSGTTRTINRFRARTPSDNSDFTGGAGSVTLKLQGSTDNFSSSVVDLWTGTTGAPGGGNYVDVNSGITTTTAYRYHRLVFGAGGAQRTVNEVEFYETTAARDEPVVIGSATIDAAATDRVAVRYDDGSGANAATKTTGINRTNATRDLAFQVVL